MNSMEVTIKSARLTAEMVNHEYKEGYVSSKNIKLETFNGEEKLTIPMTFNINGTAKEIEYIPNKGQLKRILKAWGSESDNWDGLKISFRTREVDYLGDLVDSIVAEPEVAKKM